MMNDAIYTGASADQSTNLNNQTSTQAQRRRKVLRYFHSPLTDAALTSAIHESAPSLDSRDKERIIGHCLADRLDTYGGPEDREAFRVWAVEWVTRFARLTELVKAMLPALTALAATVPASSDHQNAAARVLYRLDEYTGPIDDTEALSEWTSARAITEAQNAVTLRDWMAEHNSAVRRGVIDVLSSCSGLGIQDEHGAFNEDVVDELCRDTWTAIAERVGEFSQTGTATLAQRLRAKARFTARAWKSKQLEDRATYLRDDDITAMQREHLKSDGDSMFTRLILGKGRNSYKRRRNATDETPASIPAQTRRCISCNSVLASWNQSEQSVCIPCWNHSHDDEGTYIPRPTESVCALSLGV